MCMQSSEVNNIFISPQEVKQSIFVTLTYQLAISLYKKSSGMQTRFLLLSHKMVCCDYLSAGAFYFPFSTSQTLHYSIKPDSKGHYFIPQWCFRRKKKLKTCFLGLLRIVYHRYSSLHKSNPNTSIKGMNSQVIAMQSKSA